MQYPFPTDCPRSPRAISLRYRSNSGFHLWQFHHTVRTAQARLLTGSGSSGRLVSRHTVQFLDRKLWWRPAIGEPGETMEISKIEVGALYKCDHEGAQYFGRVKEIRTGTIGVVLGDKIEASGDRGDPIDRVGDRLVWLKPENIHPMTREL